MAGPKQELRLKGRSSGSAERPAGDLVYGRGRFDAARRPVATSQIKRGLCQR